MEKEKLIKVIEAIHIKDKDFFKHVDLKDRPNTSFYKGFCFMRDRIKEEIKSFNQEPDPAFKERYGLRTITRIENNREVDYVPLGQYVMNYDPGIEYHLIEDTLALEYTLNRILDEFRADIPKMAKILKKQGACMFKEGCRFEFNMGAFKRIENEKTM